MIRLFTLRQPIVFVLLIALVFLFHLPSLFLSVPDTLHAVTYTCFENLFSALNRERSFVYAVQCGIVILQTLHLNYIFEKHGVHYKNTFLPSLCYVIYASLFNTMDGSIWPALLAQTPLMLALETYFDLYKAPDTKAKIFNAMLFLGMGTLIYTPLLFLLPAFIISLFFVKIPSPRDFILVLTGALLPIYFGFVYCYYFGTETYFFEKFTQLWNIPHPFHFSQTRSQLVLLSGIGLIILITSARLYLNHFKNVIKTRIIQQMLFVISLISLGVLVFLLQLEFQHLFLFIIPFSYLLSYFFLGKWRFYLNEIIVLLQLASVLFLKIYPV